MQRLYFQEGVSVAVFLDRKFANGNLGNWRGKRPTPDVIAFFSPKPTLEAHGF